jgi:hypothetical protein
LIKLVNVWEVIGAFGLIERLPMLMYIGAVVPGTVTGGSHQYSLLNVVSIHPASPAIEPVLEPLEYAI